LSSSLPWGLELALFLLFLLVSGGQASLFHGHEGAGVDKAQCAHIYMLLELGSWNGLCG
jgi:hypothetical protein